MSATRTADKSKSTTTDGHAPLRQQLIDLLHGGQAHATFDEAVKDLPADLRGTVPPNLPYSAWQLLEHLRISQRDILNFSAPPTDDAWDRSIQVVHADLKTFIALIENPQSDLFKPFRWGDGQNLLREALLIADHNAYHLGELIVLRRLLGAWDK